MRPEPPGSEHARHWGLDPAFDFLNHGSFGATPRAVLDVQRELRDRLEAQPLRFLVRELEDRLDAAREALAAFLRADPDGLVFMPNTTTGVATILASLALEAGSEVVTTSHVYPAVRNALARLAARTGARIVEAPVPFPIDGPEAVEAAVLAATGPKTRLAVLDHVTSPTGLVFPIERLVPALRARGIETIVDGAHGPGQLALDLRALDAAYYVGNCHKWLCAPKGSAFVAVRADRRAAFEPLVVSHAASTFRTDRPRFRLAHDWTGTADPTPWLAVPAAIEAVGAMLPGGWPAVYARNHALAVEAQGLLAQALGIARPAPAAMLGAMAALPLAADPDPRPSAHPYNYAAQDRLYALGFELPIFAFPSYPARVLRISAHLYNDADQFRRLAAALPAVLDEDRVNVS
jgi:isopenicillin-N epimerase